MVEVHVNKGELFSQFQAHYCVSLEVIALTALLLLTGVINFNILRTLNTDIIVVPEK